MSEFKIMRTMDGTLTFEVAKKGKGEIKSVSTWGKLKGKSVSLGKLKGLDKESAIKFLNKTILENRGGGVKIDNQRIKELTKTSSQEIINKVFADLFPIKEKEDLDEKGQVDNAAELLEQRLDTQSQKSTITQENGEYKIRLHFKSPYERSAWMNEHRELKKDFNKDNFQGKSDLVLDHKGIASLLGYLDEEGKIKEGFVEKINPIMEKVIEYRREPAKHLAGVLKEFYLNNNLISDLHNVKCTVNKGNIELKPENGKDGHLIRERLNQLMHADPDVPFPEEEELITIDSSTIKYLLNQNDLSIEGQILYKEAMEEFEKLLKEDQVKASKEPKPTVSKEAVSSSSAEKADSTKEAAEEPQSAMTARECAILLKIKLNVLLSNENSTTTTNNANYSVVKNYGKNNKLIIKAEFKDAREIIRKLKAVYKTKARSHIDDEGKNLITISKENFKELMRLELGDKVDKMDNQFYQDVLKEFK